MRSIVKTDLEHALLACKSSFISVGVFSFFINLLMLVPSFYMLQVYDRVVTTNSTSTLLMLTLIMLALMITMGALEWIRSRIMVRVSTRLERALGQRLYDASFRLALSSNGANASAQPLSDLTGLRQFMTGNGLFAFFDAPWLPIYLAVMFMFHPWFGWFGILSAIMLVIFAMANEKLTHHQLQDANREHMVATSFTNKSLRNAEVVESMGMLARIRERWAKRTREVLVLQGVASDRAGAVTAMSKTSRQILQSLILALGAFLVIEQEITPGLMIAGSILLGRALAPIDQMIGVWKGFIGARGQYARLRDLLLKIPAEQPRMPLPAPNGTLTVSNLIVAPPGSRQATVKGINFSAAAGEAIGIIGPSGAGKSTLARALLGIWPALAGTVRLDSADISQWSRDDLGPYLGYLPQDIELFEGTIGENIARLGELDPDAVVEAARMAGVHEMILHLPQGYDTQVGANGGGLSGGQRQRIGLARAIYKKPRLIVLDEPNSNLDEVGERMLASCLQQLKSIGSTVVVITHRASVLSLLDKLMVLNNGEIGLYGPRDKVIAQLQANNAAPAQAAAQPNNEVSQA